MSAPSPNGVADEFRKYRHEFILRYYDMAVKDLERHLKIGWETIATAAGTIVLLGVAQQRYLPVHIAVDAAFVLSFWGMFNVIDANYWATRAIAFLANVEAIYFYYGDQKVFNPYAGTHPRFKMMDSLRYQLEATSYLLLIAGAYYVWSIAQRTGNFSAFRDKAIVIDRLTIGFWLLPLIIFILLLNRTLLLWKKRLKDYLHFVEQSPGPGMVKSRNIYRPVDLNVDISEDNMIDGHTLQKDVIQSLKESREKWITRSTTCICLSVSLFIFLALFFVFKNEERLWTYLFQWIMLFFVVEIMAFFLGLFLSSRKTKI